ncbi:hypothetical protein PR003_g8292 [Phytophthora rubi]|uniref:Uncharacterized protein n=1 Tax=Phytophthora rubi TaxID=129364 RepID=A0A6A4FJC4_9STRA|nr:hypothetical protein PR002_g8645 [Phytophthora rubi]KAE9039768.1 hypothetical protein PR001_g7365 [Phytophthora rubi]KAE9344771.1 hypothetical protein PR003_g8292 [Phytophthora rubi]
MPRTKYVFQICFFLLSCADRWTDRMFTLRARVSWSPSQHCVGRRRSLDPLCRNVRLPRTLLFIRALAKPLSTKLATSTRVLVLVRHHSCFERPVHLTVPRTHACPYRSDLGPRCPQLLPFASCFAWNPLVACSSVQSQSRDAFVTPLVRLVGHPSDALPVALRSYPWLTRSCARCVSDSKVCSAPVAALSSPTNSLRKLP